MAQGEKLRQELNGIEFSTQNIEELEREIIEKRSKLELLAGEISEERQNYAKVLSGLIIEKLEKLELPKVKFEIHFERGELSANGFDKVEFLISTNISEGLKPLAKVASGGGIVEAGGYIAGKELLVERSANRLTAPVNYKRLYHYQPRHIH